MIVYKSMTLAHPYLIIGVYMRLCPVNPKIFGLSVILRSISKTEPGFPGSEKWINRLASHFLFYNTICFRHLRFLLMLRVLVNIGGGPERFLFAFKTAP